MIIVRLQGRLGNQMFQYALAKSLQVSGKTVTIDSSVLKYDGNHNELGLFENVKSEYVEADGNLVSKLGDCNKSFPYKVKRKVIGYKKTHILEKDYAYNDEIFNMDNVYLEGYWQTEKYFKNIEDQIRKLYVFPKITDKSNLDMADIIKPCNSVSLHIRRGDYLSGKNAHMHGNICTGTYYDNAIKYIKERVDKPIFFVFTDDTEWARQQYKGEEYTIVDQNRTDNSFRDMQLMSLCKHNIIANSSFSWWGAWLNSNQDKIVIAPPKWFNLADTPNIWCDGWKVMEN
jgi:hypothetical protein